VFGVIALAAAFANPAHGQGITSSGTDFWVGFFPNEHLGNGRPLTMLTELFLASTAADTALVTYDGQTTAWPLAVNSVRTIDLQTRGITDVPETPIDRSVHIQTHAPISLYGFYDEYGSGVGGSPDGFLGLPTNSLGTEYYTVNYTEYSNFAGIEVAEFLVIAPYDSTVVTITSKSHTRSRYGAMSHSPGDTWSVMLQKGQSYLVQSSGEYSGIDDLTGSHVVSSKPVALLTGHQMADIPLDMQSADYLIEMEPPVDRWGTEYFEMPMAGRSICGDYIRIISAEDQNSITANGTPIATLNAGDWTEIPTVTTPQVYASANRKRFIVAQYSYSAHYLGDPAQADPFLVLLTGQEEFQRRILFRTPEPGQGTSYDNYVTILAPKDSMKWITINGIPATNYTLAGQAVFPGTNIGALRIQLPPGSNSYLALSNVRFGMYQYGISDYEGYGWPAGLALNGHSADTLAPAESHIQNCGDFTGTISETREPPTYSFTDSRIASVTMITQAGDPRWSRQSFNYTFALDPAFRPGDSVARFTLTVVDPSKPAYAAVYTVDFNGNDSVYEYTNASLALPPSVHLLSSSNANSVSVTVGSTAHISLTVSDLSWVPTSLNSIDLSVLNDNDALAFISATGLNGWNVTAVKIDAAEIRLHCVPSTSSTVISGERIADLQFQAYVSSAQSASVTIGNIQIDSGSAGGPLTLCGTNSIAVNYIEECGDSIVSRYMRTGSVLFSIALSPNPASSSLKITSQNETGYPSTYQLTNTLGQIVGGAITGESSFDLDVSTLPEGVYYLRATAGNALPLMRKILIER
jgi:hypothetical protein